MTEIVKTVTSFIDAAILVFGINIILYGHLTPGGGFAGGLIIAFLFILLFLAFGKEGAFKKLPLSTAHTLDSLGMGVFIVIGLGGIIVGGSFLANFIQSYFPGGEFNLFSAGVILPLNIAIGLKVAVSVFAVFAVLAIFTGEKND